MAGLATFLRSPYVVQPTLADGDVAVIGVPYDEGTTGRAGAREGPQALRVISGQWAYREDAEAFWDGEADLSLLAGVRFVDTGDVYLPPTAPAGGQLPSHRHQAGRSCCVPGCSRSCWAETTPSPIPCSSASSG